MALDDTGTVALLHMNGSDASTTFTDESGKTWTANGNAQIDTAQSVFGGASALFDGTGDFIDTPDSADFYMGSDNFTVDFRIRFNTITNTQQIAGQCNSTPAVVSIGFFLTFDTSADKMQGGLYSGSSGYTAISTASVSAGQWYHVALVRNGNNMAIALDGTFGSNVNVTGVTMNNSTNKFAIGRLGEYASAYFDGWIDEFRVSKGIARWTANFTPPPWEHGFYGQVLGEDNIAYPR